jgi:hypothetical protein
MASTGSSGRSGSRLVASAPTRWTARAGACALLVFSLLTPRAASGAASARLVYVRGPGGEQCPQEQAIRAAVRMRLGYDPFYAWARDTLFVRVTQTDGVFRVQITLAGDDNTQRGAREISAREADCAAIVDAMALTISLAIDPTSIIGLPSTSAPASSENPAPATPSAPRGPTPSAPDASAPTLPSPPPQPDAPRTAFAVRRAEASAVQAWLGASTRVSLGTAPAAAVGGVLSADARWRALSLAIEGRADVDASGASSVQGVLVRSRVLVASLVPCIHLAHVFGCLVASVGYLTAQSEGTGVSSITSNAPWWALGPRAGVDLPLSRAFALDAYAEVQWIPAPDWATLLDGRRVYNFSSITGGLGIAASWRFL